MAWFIASVVLLLVVATVLMNLPVMRCPCCQRINLFRRQKLEGHQEELTDVGDPLWSAREYRCSRCDGAFWITWHDLEGRFAGRQPNTREK
jgi:hypothetical protein